MKPKLAILYLEYDPQRYPDSFHLLQSYLNKINFCHKVYLKIDNREEGDYIKRISPSIFKVGGDNSSREFSGWQKGLDALNALGLDTHLILFVNEAFLKNGRSFLEKHAGPVLMAKALLGNAVVGKINRSENKISAFGYDVSEWICTNCFFVPRKIIKEIKNVVTIDRTTLDHITEQQFRSRILWQKTMSGADLKNGHLAMTCRTYPSDEPLYLRIELDNSFTPRTKKHKYYGRELGLFVKRITVNGQGLQASQLMMGWYPQDGGGRWINRVAEAKLPADSPAQVVLEGYIPENVFKNIYRENVVLTISAHHGYFKSDVPLSAALQNHLLEWLMLRWHSKAKITAENFDLFREKVGAILNEQLLSARIKEKGFRIMPYSLMESWIRKCQSAIYRLLWGKRREAMGCHEGDPSSSNLKGE
jgi:hypothetical protein